MGRGLLMIYKHIYQTGTKLDLPTLLLFHGTGGSEHDLLPVAEKISPDSSVLGVRGNVLENGLPRFFRRLLEGVFDEVDLVKRTHDLKKFIDEAAKHYGFDRSNLVAIGYSNGANMVGSLLFHYPSIFRGAILHHPMVPIRGIQLPSMKGLPVYIGAGRNDMVCSPEEADELKHMLQEAGARVTIHWENYGHQLTSTEVTKAAEWFGHHFRS